MADEKLKVVGISATNRAPEIKAESHSEEALKEVLALMEKDGAQTKFIRVSDLKIHTCEANYSQNPKLCTWPCQNTMKYEDDQMKVIYDAILESDIVLFGTPIRWNNCSSLMQKVIERLNCIENQYSVNQKRLIENKVAGVVVVGHEDGAQHVAGNLLNVLTFMGFHIPPFSICYWVGESAEDTENDTERIKSSKEFSELKQDLARECMALAKMLKKEKA